MGKYLSVIGGIIAVIAGIIVLFNWFDDVLVIVRAMLVMALILGGMLAFFAGFTEIKEVSALNKKEDKQ
ncbi:MAG: hypothetical protein V1933_08670 [Candidatus Omnitrophota bacterium]